MDEVFKALADPSRRRLLDGLNECNGQNLRELCAGLAMARQSVSKHLAVLEEAGLITTVWRGREKLHFLNPAPIGDIADRWINLYDRRRVDALSTLKRALEDPTVGKPEFVYTTYIQATPERVWQALTDPAFTEQYWGCSLISDWRKGSAYAVHQRGVVIDHPDQVVLESDPYRRLSYAWHTFTDEWGRAFDFDPEWVAHIAAEPRSRVTFDLEEHGATVKLTVTHDGFDEGSEVLAGISDGWPAIISGLKTLLETGSVSR
jgi:uncharacterized protein YndB with AHSA1/START domain/DNA-binding transcriptional ArsR family regulator